MKLTDLVSYVMGCMFWDGLATNLLTLLSYALNDARIMVQSAAVMCRCLVSHLSGQDAGVSQLQLDAGILAYLQTVFFVFLSQVGLHQCLSGALTCSTPALPSLGGLHA